MIEITHILSPECTRAAFGAQSRKRALEQASDLLAESAPGLSARALFDGLMSRERLGSTGLGDGVAIPHCRLACPRILGAFLHLSTPVDFDAIDGQPVDLVFVLVVPPEETSAHLETLATLAKLFQKADNRARLREQPSDAALYDTLVGLVRTGAA